MLPLSRWPGMGFLYPPTGAGGGLQQQVEYISIYISIYHIYILRLSFNLYCIYISIYLFCINYLYIYLLPLSIYLCSQFPVQHGAGWYRVQLRYPAHRPDDSLRGGEGTHSTGKSRHSYENQIVRFYSETCTSSKSPLPPPSPFYLLPSFLLSFLPSFLPGPSFLPPFLPSFLRF